MNNSELGLRPVGAIGAYASESSGPGGNSEFFLRNKSCLYFLNSRVPKMLLLFLHRAVYFELQIM